jgi:hypothetical protein
MAPNLLFYYFGDDEAYFRTLVGEFNKTTRLSITFERIFESEEKKIQSLYLKIFKNKPACVFIDFSKHSQDYLHLARIMSRTPMEHSLVTVGLVDYLSPQEILMESIATGVNLTHIKSAESFDVVFDVAKLVSPSEAVEHGFATATLKENWEGGIPVKVGYVHAGGLHFETDFKLEKGDRFRMNHHWAEKKIVPSREFFVQEVSSKNLYYHFQYAIDVEFLFVDEFLPPEGMEIERIEERKIERDELIHFHRKQLSSWIDDNASLSQEKKAKVLVVDREFHFYDHQQRTDKHAYTIRCVPNIEDIGVELDRMEPQVIAFAMESEEELGKEVKNSTAQLSRLVEAVRVKFQDAPPFLVVFNSEADSKNLQETLGYPHIMATTNSLSVDVMVRMADIFDKKMAQSVVMQKTKIRGQNPKKVFLKKTNLASIAEVLLPITVVKLSETDMILQSETPLTVGMNLHLLNPVDMFVNIQPTKTQSKSPEYHGLIHCLGEDQKKELRKFVNSVFFREHDAKVSADAEGFRLLNEAKLQQREEALKKQEEEALKEQAEAAKDAEEALELPKTEPEP